MKSFTPTAAQVAAAETVFMAMAAVATVQPIVQNYQRGILQDLGWGHFDPRDSWQLPDDVFAVYNQRCHEARDASGLKVDNPEFCPLLVAEHLLSQSQRALIESVEPITGIDPDRLLCLGLEEYREYVDLTLRLLAPYVKGGL